MLSLILAGLFVLADPAPPPAPAPAPAPLAISGPARVAPYTIGEFRLVNAPPKAAVLWQVSDRRASVKKPVKGLLQVVARPGDVELTAQVITLDPATGEASVEEVTLTTTFEGDAVPPQPSPGPTPPAPAPKPAPLGPGAKLKAVIVEETEVAAVARSTWFESPELASRWKANGWPPAVILDQNVKDPATGLPPASAKAYLARAAGKSLPQLYLVNQSTGDVLYEGPAYQSPAELAKIIDSIMGIK